MISEMFDIGIRFFLQKLIETCMLVQASRGGGKSFLVRRMLEVLSGHCQQIVLDIEGEFVTLREKFPFALLAVQGGDIPLNVRHAHTYAEKFMESGMSVIIDLSDLSPADRKIFVRDFLHALMNLPKHLYHPLLVYIDEAHVFCPQDEDAVSYGAIIDVAARGRKRDIGMVLSTQRVSKLHKDVTAELLNKVIGRTGQDIDQARAAKELDWKPAEKTALRRLDPGDFYCFGPAFQEDIVKFHVQQVLTSHKKIGSTAQMAFPAPEAIKAALLMLQDLPEEAERELTTVAELQAELARLRLIKAVNSVADPASVEAIAELEDLRMKYAKLNIHANLYKRHLTEIQLLRDDLADCLQTIQKFSEVCDGVITLLATDDEGMPPMSLYQAGKILAKIPSIVADVALKATAPTPVRLPDATDKPIGKCAGLILSFLASYDREFSKAQIGVATGYSPLSSGFQNSLAELNSKGFIIRGKGIRANKSNIKAIADAIGTVKKKKIDISTFRDKLGKCEAEIYDVVLAHPGLKFSKEGLAGRTVSKYSPTSSGFQNSLSRLNTLELIRRENGQLFLNPELAEFL